VSGFITALGTGDAFSSGGRGHTCWLIEDAAGLALVDAGGTVLPALRWAQVDPRRIAVVHFTHLHGDHIAGWPFLLSRQSENLGDLCLFLNMILFQVFWNMLTFAPLGHPSSLLEFGGRLFFLCFIALLIYFPPRMFYLAEDINRRRTWLTMLLANSPVIIRVLIGTGSNSPGW